jgi:hypothetical protein
MSDSPTDPARLYRICPLPLREQLRDTYRVLFFPALLGIAALLVWRLHAPAPILLGAVLGAAPSLRFGTPARMMISEGDDARIDVLMLRWKHERDARGWVPRLPRGLYFDSQIVRCESNAVVGPIITLRKLRSILQPASKLDA